MPKRGPKISPRIRALIHQRALEEPRLPRDAVAVHLIDEIGRMGLIAPSEETLMKMISRERNREPDPLDEPWSLGALRKYRYDFRAEVIPKLIEIRKLQTRNDWNGPKVLTVRQAQWVSRLYDLIKEICLTRNLNLGRDPLWIVLAVADMYAKMEEMKEIVGEKPDTSDLDSELFITETFWDQPIEKWAADYAAVQGLHDSIMKEYRHDPTKKRNYDNNAGDGSQ